MFSGNEQPQNCFALNLIMIQIKYLIPYGVTTSYFQLIHQFHLRGIAQRFSISSHWFAASKSQYLYEGIAGDFLILAVWIFIGKHQKIYTCFLSLSLIHSASHLQVDSTENQLEVQESSVAFQPKKAEDAEKAAGQSFQISSHTREKEKM